MTEFEPQPEISRREFERRVRAVRNAMKHKNLDVILIFGAGGTSTGNVRYLSSWYSRSIYNQTLLVLPLESDPILFIRLKPYRAKRVSWIDQIHESGKPGHLELAKDCKSTLKSLRLADGHIGLLGSLEETWRGILEVKLKRMLPQAVFEDADELLLTQRLIKSPVEIEKMVNTGSLVNSSLQAFREVLCKEKTEFEVISESEYVARSKGAEEMLNYIGVSPDGEFVPPISLAPPSRRRFKHRDVVIVELNVCCGGYRCESVRMASLGHPAKGERDIFETTHACYEKVLKEAIPGRTVGQVVEAGHKVLSEMGYSAERYVPRTHLKKGILGHGIGLDMFEPPVLTAKNKIVLRPGMTFVLHPGLFGALAGSKWGALLGDTIVINNFGAQPVCKMEWLVQDFAVI